MQTLPTHPRIASYRLGFPIYRFIRPQTIFWQLQDYLRAKLQTTSIRANENMIWHATYFQLPNWWPGPKVTTVYDLVHEKFPHFFNKNYDEILRQRKKRAVLAADKVICISESVRSEAIDSYGLPSEKVVAIPLACGDIFRRLSKEEITSNQRVEQPFILYVGMRQHYKNFKTLLSAYSVWPRRKEVQLMVVGNPWSDEEKKQMIASGIESNVVCRSGITDEELCALYNQALAFVYPSLSEGFGIPLLEAMACGCPIVASRIPIFREVAGDIPYFFDPLNKEELIAALEAACFSKGTQTIRDDILTIYSWDRNAQTTLKLYKELASCI
jgi:glycosyltransferase involved in cell wall biosynthesis